MNSLVAVHYKLVRDGITRILKEDPDINVIGSAKNQEELCAYDYQGDKIDVVILDLDIPDMNTLETISNVLEKQPDTHILGISGSEDPRQIRKVMKAGASGYIFKKRGAEELKKAVKEVFCGKQYLCNETIALLVKGKDTEDDKDRIANLTKRELEVLELICEEKINREVAEELGISIRTVDAHRRNLLQKTGARNTAGLVKFAIKYKFYDLK